MQSSQAAEFSSKAGNRWTGTAAEGAATSLETLPRRALQEGRQHSAAAPRGAAPCRWADGRAARAARGDAISGRNPPGVAPSDVRSPVPRICSL